MDEKIEPAEGVVVEELPDTSQYKGRYPRAVAEKVKAVKAAKALEPKKPSLQALARQQKVAEFYNQLILSDFNATEAAWIVFKPKNRHVAAQMGSVLLKEMEPELARTYFEKKNRGYGKFLEEAWDKMLDSKTPEWWDRLMAMQGYKDFTAAKDSKGGGNPTVNIIQVQKDLMTEYVEGEVIEDDE